MSADMLRRAAATIRERAEAADPQFWDVTGLMDAHAPYMEDGDPYLRADAEHIASWHPDVTRAIADWLDGVARRAQFFDHPADHDESYDDAVTVARAYLGEAGA